MTTVPLDEPDERELQAIEDAKLPRVLHDEHCMPYVPEHPCWCRARERWDWHLAHPGEVQDIDEGPGQLDGAR